jgi:hypothetical protein
MFSSWRAVRYGCEETFPVADPLTARAMSRKREAGQVSVAAQ